MNPCSSPHNIYPVTRLGQTFSIGLYELQPSMNASPQQQPASRNAQTLSAISRKAEGPECRRACKGDTGNRCGATRTSAMHRVEIPKLALGPALHRLGK